MKEVILITGANGTLAKKLGKQLEDRYSIRYLSRKPIGKNQYLWNLETRYIDPKALKNIHTIIHLAGSSISAKRWTKKRKQVILSSRVDSANLILDELKKNGQKIQTFISASAIGFYGTKTTETTYNEEHENGEDFLSQVCDKWEGAAQQFKLSNIADRIVIVRIGIIFSNKEGALSKIILPIKYGLGSSIGTGKQYMPWIHIQDLCNLFVFLTKKDDLYGVFNAVAPHHITNNLLTRKIGKLLNRRILLPNIPKFIFQFLFGEMSTILLNGSKVSSQKIMKQGFKFKYGELDLALYNLLITKNRFNNA